MVRVIQVPQSPPWVTVFYSMSYICKENSWACGRLEGGGEGKKKKQTYWGGVFLHSFLRFLFLLTELRISESQHEVVTNFRVLR